MRILLFVALACTSFSNCRSTSRRQTWVATEASEDYGPAEDAQAGAAQDAQAGAAEDAQAGAAEQEQGISDEGSESSSHGENEELEDLVVIGARALRQLQCQADLARAQQQRREYFWKQFFHHMAWMIGAARDFRMQNSSFYECMPASKRPRVVLSQCADVANGGVAACSSTSGHGGETHLGGDTFCRPSWLGGEAHPGGEASPGGEANPGGEAQGPGGDAHPGGGEANPSGETHPAGGEADNHVVHGWGILEHVLELLPSGETHPSGEANPAGGEANPAGGEAHPADGLSLIHI